MAEDQRRGRRGGVDTSVRTSAVWDAVRAVVTRRSDELGRPLRVVDLGGGTGGLAVPIAALGHHVTVVDPSPDALAALTRRAGDAGVADRVVARPGRRRDPARGAPRAPTPTWSAATARSRSSTTPPRRCAPSRRCSPTAATSACSSPSASPWCSPAPCPGTSPRPGTPSPATTAAGAPGDPLPRRFDAAGVAALVQRGRPHRAGLPRRADLQRPGARGVHRLRGRPPAPARAGAGGLPPPRLRLPRPARCRTARPRQPFLTTATATAAAGDTGRGLGAAAPPVTVPSAAGGQPGRDVLTQATRSSLCRDEPAPVRRTRPARSGRTG